MQLLLTKTSHQPEQAKAAFLLLALLTPKDYVCS
jgi:hypothetical protein